VDLVFADLLRQLQALGVGEGGRGGCGQQEARLDLAAGRPIDHLGAVAQLGRLDQAGQQA
jgi:hypothetical protein